MRKLLALTVILAVSSWASAEEIVLVDNIGDMSDLTGLTHAAQDFESTYDVYDCAVIDDFDVPGDGYTITQIEALVGFWNGAGTEDIDDPSGYNIGIFSDSALIAETLEGDVANIAGAAYDDGDADTGWVQFDVNIELDAGTYWVSVQPDMAYSSYGQCGILSTYLGNLNGVQGNPGGGFGIEDNMQTIQDSYDDDVSAAYLVRAIPEPASLVLLGLGALLIRRR